MMKWFVRIGSVAIALLVILAGVAYTQIFGFTQSKEVTKSTYLIYNSGGLSRIGANLVAIDAGDSWVVFDTHLGPLAKSAFKKIKSIKDAPVRYAFNSHWHPDHSGGNAAFTDEAEIVAHENVRQILARSHEGFGLTKPGAYRRYEAVPAEGLPELLVSEGKSFTVGGLSIEAVHYPAAHTDGDLVVYVPTLKIVAIGDLVWPQGFPFIDVHSGGRAKGVADALRDMLARTDDSYLYVMGHGEPYSADQLRKYLGMIEETVGHVESRISAGKSLKEIQAEGLPDKWSAWETKLNPQEEWIRMIFETRNRG